MPILEIKELTKRYPTVEALQGISLTVEKGQFYGLLGPNGAGKTTTIGIITGLVNKTAGRVVIGSHDIDKEFSRAKQVLGVVPQEMNFSIFETPYEIIVNQAGYYGVPRKIARARTVKLLKQLDLYEKRDQQSRHLSGGMKRRLMIARALVHEPRLLILDEPTAGVDVELRREMWVYLQRLNKKGITIILTTHYLEEAEQLCSHIAIIDRGILVENAPKRQLLDKLEAETFVFYLREPVSALPPLEGFALRLLDPTTVEVEMRNGQGFSKIFQYFDTHKIHIVSMRNKANRLEELFLRLTRRKG